MIAFRCNRSVVWMRTLWFVLLAALLVPLTSCVRQPSDKYIDEEGKERILIDYWEKWTGFEGEAMQAIVDDFNAAQDKYFVQKLTISDIERKMMLATAGGNPPDVAGLWSHSVPVYAEKGALTPLDSMIKKAGIKKEDYIDVFWRLCSHKGFVWALPSTPATVALHWNKKMFRDAGLNPDRPPRTLAELDAMAEKITTVDVERNGKVKRVRYSELTEEEKKAKEFNLITLGYTASEPGWWNGMWGFWFGADLWDGVSKITLTSDANIQAFTWFGHYTGKYGLNNMRKFGASFGNFASPQNPFLDGRVAMILQGTWMYNFIDKYAPSLEWGAAPFPANDIEATPLVTIAETDVLVIPKGARHVEGAFEFIKFVNTQKELEKLALGQRKFSPLREISDDFVKKHPNPYIQTFIDLAHSDNARTIPPLAAWKIISEEMIVACDRIFNEIMTVEEALGEANERIQWSFDRELRRWNMIKEKRIKEWSSL